MTGTEFTTTRIALGLSCAGLARALGMDPHTVGRYEAKMWDDVPVVAGLAILALWHRLGEAP